MPQLPEVEDARAPIDARARAMHRRGKAMWLETSGDGPMLSLHSTSLRR